MVSRAPTEEPEHLSTAMQVTGQHGSWAGMKTALTRLTEHLESKMVQDSNPGLQQHRITAQESSQAGKKEDVPGAHPAVPQHYIGVGFTDLSTQ